MKHCGESRHCSLWAISYFVTRFSNYVLQKRQKCVQLGRGLEEKNHKIWKQKFLLLRYAVLKTFWEKETLLVWAISSIIHDTFIIHNSFAAKAFNPFQPIDAFWCIRSRRLLKTWWQKEKLLKTSNFSFCHNVFDYFQ